jgi:hypothetical protein
MIAGSSTGSGAIYPATFITATTSGGYGRPCDIPRHGGETEKE